MVSKNQIDRINALARKAKAEGLSEEEKEEQLDLRQAYLKAFRKNFKRQLDSIEIVD